MDRTFIPLDTRDQTGQSRPASIAAAVRNVAVVLSTALALTAGASLAWARLRPDPQQPRVPIAQADKTPADAKVKTKKAVVPFVMLPTNHMLVECGSTARGRTT